MDGIGAGCEGSLDDGFGIEEIEVFGALRCRYDRPDREVSTGSLDAPSDLTAIGDEECPDRFDARG
jgi:hypothetical protein